MSQCKKDSILINVPLDTVITNTYFSLGNSIEDVRNSQKNNELLYFNKRRVTQLPSDKFYWITQNEPKGDNADEFLIGKLDYFGTYCFIPFFICTSMNNKAVKTQLSKMFKFIEEDRGYTLYAAYLDCGLYKKMWHKLPNTICTNTLNGKGLNIKNILQRSNKNILNL